MNRWACEVTAVGNHEFDEGVDRAAADAERRLPPDNGCQDGDAFAGADFQYLAANVIASHDRQADLSPPTTKNVKQRRSASSA